MRKLAFLLGILLFVGCNKRDGGINSEPAPEPEQRWAFIVENQTRGSIGIVVGEKIVSIPIAESRCIAEQCSIEEWERQGLVMMLEEKVVSDDIWNLKHWTRERGNYTLSVTPMLLESFEVHLE